MSILEVRSNREENQTIEEGQQSLEEIHAKLDEKYKDTFQNTKELKVPNDLLQIGDFILDIPKKIVGTRHVFLNKHAVSKEAREENIRLQTLLVDLLEIQKVYESYTSSPVGFVNFHYVAEGIDESHLQLTKTLQAYEKDIKVQTFFYKVENGKRSLEIDYQHLAEHLILLYGDNMTKGLFFDIQKALENVGKTVVCFYKTIAV